jgi:hypothetical protein
LFVCCWLQVWLDPVCPSSSAEMTGTSNQLINVEPEELKFECTSRFLYMSYLPCSYIFTP